MSPTPLQIATRARALREEAAQRGEHVPLPEAVQLAIQQLGRPELPEEPAPDPEEQRRQDVLASAVTLAERARRLQAQAAAAGQDLNAVDAVRLAQRNADLGS